MKKLWLFLVIGILIRVILAFSTFHPDIQAFNLAGKIVASGNILDLYDFSSEKAVFNYPPLIYWFHGIFSLIPFSNYGFVKLPYIVFDLLVAYILLKLFSQKDSALLAVSLWIFNPINLYATYMMGQFDIIPTFFTLLSFYFISKDKLNLAALSLGGGIAFKLYPVFLLIPFLFLGKTFFDKFKLGILAVLPYVLSILPYISSSSFRSTALFANQSSKSLYANIPVSGGESILLFPFSLILFYLFVWQNKYREFSLSLYLIPLLLFFMFTHFHPQWLIWITPFIIVMLVEQNFKNLAPILLMLVSYLLSLFFFDPSLTVGLFAPLIPVLNGSLSIWEQLGLTMDYNLVRSLLQTIFVAASFFLVFLHLSDKRKE